MGRVDGPKGGVDRVCKGRNALGFQHEASGILFAAGKMNGASEPEETDDFTNHLSKQGQVIWRWFGVDDLRSQVISSHLGR